MHGELRKYVILRAIKKDLKDTVFGFGPLQDLLQRLQRRLFVEVLFPYYTESPHS